MSRLYIIAVALFFAIGGAASATDVWFSDSKATSQNGRYHATGKSPENKKKRPEPFARNFTFELHDKVAKKRLWKFNTGEDGEPGGSLYVSNTGDVIRMGVYETLWLINISGKQIKLGQVFDQLPESEIDAYCDRTSAGIFWSQFSHRGFIHIGEREYFFIRTYWGRYIIADIAAGKLTKSQKVARKIEQQILKKAKKFTQSEEKDWWEVCKSCGDEHPNSKAARILLVLELHQIKGRDILIKGFSKKENNHMHDVLEHAQRIKKARAKRK